ncbi:hypothetical protein Tco_0447492, partial [Tanacetum coccineum]
MDEKKINVVEKEVSTADPVTTADEVIVPVEEIKAEALKVKYPIIDWEIHTEGSIKYWRIIR